MTDSPPPDPPGLEAKVDQLIAERHLVIDLLGATAKLALTTLLTAGATGFVLAWTIAAEEDRSQIPVQVAAAVGIVGSIITLVLARRTVNLVGAYRDKQATNVGSREPLLARLDAALKDKPDAARFLASMVPLAAAAVTALGGVIVVLLARS